ncbi:MAG: BMC domain-containing protein [Bacillota bacterium]
MHRAIGMIESQSIATGIFLADAMLKASDVEVLASSTVCPGKHTTLIGGEVAAVENSIQVARRLGGSHIVDSILIPNVHDQLFPAIKGAVEPPPYQSYRSIGVIESFSIASLIVAADTAAKTADVTLYEIRLGWAIGGKAFVTLMGDVAAVQAAVDAGALGLEEQGLLVSKIVIPAPHPELVRAMG